MALIEQIIKQPDEEWSRNGTKVHMFVQKTSFELKFSFIPDLYLSPNHLKTQGTDDLFSFLLYKNRESEASALFRLHSCDGNQWTSPGKAPFGGIAFSETCDESELLFLMQCVERFVQRRGGKIVKIKTAPSVYYEKLPEILFLCYSKSGYKLLSNLKNHFIRVSPTNFENRINSAEKRRLARCRRQEFRITGDEEISFEIIHTFIKSVRDEAGFSLSMTARELSELVSFCRKQIVIFCCFDQNKLIAVTITVRVNAFVLYNFLSASLSAYRNFSPMVMLIGAVYHHCQNENIAILDLGTSLDHLGVEKPKLIRFKENLGAEVCEKITWQKILNSEAIPVAVKDC